MIKPAFKSIIEGRKISADIWFANKEWTCKCGAPNLIKWKKWLMDECWCCGELRET